MSSDPASGGGFVPDFATYDLIVVSSSGGKDSAVVLDRTVKLAEAAGVRDRIHVVHAELGDVEWPGVPELAARHAARYGLPFHTVAHDLSLIELIERRGRWPSSSARYCTSDAKRGPIRKLLTALVRDLRESGEVTGRPVRILSVLGMRAEESAARAKRPAFSFDAGASNGRRHVDEWLAVHHYTLEDVRRVHETEQLELHPAYRPGAGMSRLSCSLCVLAGREDLHRAVRLRPTLTARYAAMEQQMGHTFQHGCSIADLQAGAAAPPAMTLFAPADAGLDWDCPTWPPNLRPEDLDQDLDLVALASAA